MTTSQFLTAPPRPIVLAQVARAESRGLAPSILFTPWATVQPVPVQELLCRWVPGTTNVVRLTIIVEQGGEQTIELNSARLSRIFGREVMHDLYLKGRAQVSADPQQIALLRRDETVLT